MQDKLQKYMDQNRFYHFDGDRGVQRLETVLSEVCGYGPYNTLQMFLEDNPGAIEAMLQWVGEQRNAEWENNLDQMGLGDDEGEEE